MKKSLFFALVLSTVLANAQTDKTIFAVTGVDNKAINFKDIRAIDVYSPSNEKVYFEKQQAVEYTGNNKNSNCTCAYNSSLIAGMSQDKFGNLLYMPMMADQIYVYNIKSQTVLPVVLENSVVTPANQNSYFARMGTAADGAVYALNNDGSELIKLNYSNGTYSSENLGKLIGIDKVIDQVQEVKAIYGGDIIADNAGNIFVISALGYVFKVDLQTLETEYLSKISGLPGDFTVNGAAVLEDGKVLLASSKGEAFYKLDFDTFKATFMFNNAQAFYDLSSNNLLKSKKMVESNQGIAVKPTLIYDRTVNINASVNKQDVVANVYDNSGVLVAQKKIKIENGDFSFNLNSSLPKGIYVVKITKTNGEELNTTRITIMK